MTETASANKWSISCLSALPVGTLMCSRVNRVTDKREAAPTSCYINTSDGGNKRICYQWSYQLPARQEKKKKNTSSGLKPSADALPEWTGRGRGRGGGDTGGGGGGQPGRYSRNVMYSRRQSYRNGILLCSRADEDQSWRRQKRESCCWRMQQVFSPLCVVSARITTVEEERRGEGGEGGGWPGRAAVRRALHSGWRSPAPAWKQANGLCSA